MRSMSGVRIRHSKLAKATVAVPGLPTPNCLVTLMPRFMLGNTFFAVFAQSLSCVRLFVSHGLQHTRPPAPYRLLWFAQVHVLESEMLFNHLILCRLLLLLSSVFPIIRVFSSESAFHIRWPTCVNSVSPTTCQVDRSRHIL